VPDLWLVSELLGDILPGETVAKPASLGLGTLPRGPLSAVAHSLPIVAIAGGWGAAVGTDEGGGAVEETKEERGWVNKEALNPQETLFGVLADLSVGPDFFKPGFSCATTLLALIQGRPAGHEHFPLPQGGESNVPLALQIDRASNATGLTPHAAPFRPSALVAAVQAAGLPLSASPPEPWALATEAPQAPQSPQAPQAPVAALAPAGGEPEVVPEHRRTTVMLCNLPHRYSRELLMDLLNTKGFGGMYDFIYLPFDFKTHACLGYAFVNMVDPSAVQELWLALQGFADWEVQHNKACRITWSLPHQGREVMVNRFRNSPVMHAKVPQQFKPVLFQDGEQVAFPLSTRACRAPRARDLERLQGDRPRQSRQFAAAIGGGGGGGGGGERPRRSLREAEVEVPQEAAQYQ